MANSDDEDFIYFQKSIANSKTGIRSMVWW